MQSVHIGVFNLVALILNNREDTESSTGKEKGTSFFEFVATFSSLHVQWVIVIASYFGVFGFKSRVDSNCRGLHHSIAAVVSVSNAAPKSIIRT